MDNLYYFPPGERHRRAPKQRFSPLRYCLTALVLLLVAGVVSASDVVEATVITKRIILLRFDDGHIDYDVTNGGNVVYDNELDTAGIRNLSAWSIQSATAGAYANPRNPVAIGRKSKAGEVNTLFTSVSRRWVLDHWVYLVLPSDLVEGNTYTIDLGGFAANRRTIDLEFNASTLRSEAIHVNQLGFVPNSPKYAYISQWMGDLNNGSIVDGKGKFGAYDGARFDVVRMDNNQSVFNGTVRMRKNIVDGGPMTPSVNDGRTRRIFTGVQPPINPISFPQNFSFSDVLEADFSSLTTPGQYRVVVEGMGCSFQFEIANDAFRDAFAYTMRGIFFQRQGVILELPDGRTRPRDFHPDDIPESRFRYDKTRWIDDPRDKVESVPGNFAGSLPTYGWYHDAGDWDSNPSHCRVPMSLMFLYNLKPQNFGDGDVGNRYKLKESDPWIDEGNDGLPDILNEARWLIDYYRRTKDEGLARGLTTGGVPGGYVGVDAGALSGTPSWEDERNLRITAEDPHQTFVYAAVAAWYATSLRVAGGSTAEINDWINEAQQAYTWAVNNAAPADYDLWREATRKARILADAALYQATQNTSFQTSFKNQIEVLPEYIGGEEGWGAPEFWEYAAAIYAGLPTNFPGLNVAFQNQVKAKILSVADVSYVEPSSRRGYRVAFNDFKFHILGMQSTPMMPLLLMASKLSTDSKYLDAIHTSSAFFLGGNQESICWISGLGEKTIKYPFHPNSWFLYDFDSKSYSNEILPGLVPYGSYQSPDWAGFGFAWEGDEDFSKSTMFPRYVYQTWPIMEQRVENRSSIPGSEYTIWQNGASSAMVYGFLLNNATNNNYSFNSRPKITSINAPNLVNAEAGAVLTVNASSDTRRVGYWLEEIFLGYSYDRANNFRFEWSPNLKSSRNDLLLTAIAWDNQGLISLPSDAGDKLIDVVTPRVFDQTNDANGLVSLESEEFSTRENGSGIYANLNWEERTDADASREKFMIVPENGGNEVNARGSQNAAKLNFRVDFVKTGPHYVWTRHRSPNGADNSVTAAFDGNTVEQVMTFGSGSQQWVWSRHATTFNVSQKGIQTFSIQMREDGTPIDKHFITTNANFDPNTFTGPFDQTLDRNGLVSLEAEEASRRITGTGNFAGRTWNEVADSDADNGAFMVVPNVGSAQGVGGRDAGSPTLEFDVDFRKTGTHYIWARYRAPSGADNSIVTLLDGEVLEEVFTFASSTSDWTWIRLDESFTITELGVRTFGVRMREDGTPLDRFFITTNADFDPENIFGGGPFLQSTGPDGLVSLEAEEHNDNVTGTGSFSSLNWTEMSDATASNGAYMVVPNASPEVNANINLSSPRLDFEIDFVKTGTHYIWVRHRSPSGTNNSITAAYNNTLVGRAMNMNASPSAWTWTRLVNTFTVTGTGVNVVNIHMREDGTPIDQILITTNPNFSPDGSSAGGGPFQQSTGPEGLVSMEAEQHNDNVTGAGSFGSLNWTEVSDGTASNGAYMIVPNASPEVNADVNLSSPRLDFEVNFVKTGTHYIWVRHRSPGGTNNSITAAYNNSLVGRAMNMDPSPSAWTWTRLVNTFTVAGTGTNVVNIHMREDGTPIDRIFITTSTSFNPNSAALAAPPGPPAQSFLGAPAIDADITTTVFPNPTADGWINVRISESVEHGRVNIYDLNGRILRSLPLSGQHAQFRIINSGVYIIRINRGKEEIATRRVVVR